MMVNPVEINEDIIKGIQKDIYDILEKKGMLFNQYYNIGLSKCYFVIYDYNIVYKKRKLG